MCVRACVRACVCVVVVVVVVVVCCLFCFVAVVFGGVPVPKIVKLRCVRVRRL